MCTVQYMSPYITYLPRNRRRGECQKMSRKTVRSIQELGELFTHRDGVDNVSDSKFWGPFNRIFRVSMKSSKMAVPKSFEAKLTRWFHLPDDTNDEQSIKRAELQTVGKCCMSNLCFSIA